MESRMNTSAVMRRLRPLAGSYRYYPYTTKGMVSGKKEMKEEVVRLGVEFFTHVAQSMFLLCDADISILSLFCYRLLTSVTTPVTNPVLERLLRVIHYVYSENMTKPKKKKENCDEDGCGNFDQDRVFALIRTTWKDFVDGIMILSRLDLALRRNLGCFDDCQLSWAIVRFKEDVLKKLEEKLRDDVNGFARETIESNIFDLWKSHFDDDDEKDKEAAAQAVSNRMRSSDLFRPLTGKMESVQIPGLVYISPPYILGEDFKTQEAKVEVVRLGVELCLYVAQSLFLLCDDVRSVLAFCHAIWIGAGRGVINENVINESHVMDRVLLVMHHVYFRYIEPKKGVYHYQIQIHDMGSVHWELVIESGKYLYHGFKHLNDVAHSIKGGGKCGREFTIPVEKMLKRVEKKLGGVEEKGFAEANGFDRDAIESDVLEIWKSLYDVEAKEATTTLQDIKSRLNLDLFQPLYDEEDAQPQEV